jgi:ABC-2 type transport system ATP-binding protein
VLELKSLTRRFGGIVALDDLSFTVNKATVVGFLGPNGAGKTTAMRAVFGLVALDSGAVRWDGHGVGAQDRRQFGYMPEERGLYPGMQVGEQLSYIGRLHGLSRSAAETAGREWAERLGIAERLNDKVEALSLGNQQRAQLAAALVHEPELLVLDEPFSGMDPVGTETMSTVLAERAKAGTAVLFSSHQLDLVEHICEEVAIVHRGRLVASGAVDELTRGDEPVLEVKVAGDAEGDWAEPLGPLGSVTGSQHGVVRFMLAHGADSQVVLDAARAAGTVEQFGFARRHLSEIFREAVGI